MGKIERMKNKEKKLKRQALIEKERDEDSGDVSLDEVEVSGEVIKKEYISEDMLVSRAYVVPVGPTSFDELDAQKAAAEQAHEVRELSWNVQDLVYNIVSAPMSPEEKAKAIGNVGADFGKRIKKVSAEKIEKALDMDALELQVILAKHKRSSGIIEKVTEWIGKARVDSETPYPVETKNEVLFSLEKMVKSLDANPQSEDRNLIPQVKEAAKKFNIASLDSTRNSIVIEKDKSGTYRAVMWPSNNFQDYDGDILSKAAHEEYVEWVNQNMNLAPVFTIWHKPEFIRKNRVDFVGYENGFLIMSAPLEKEEAAGLMRAQLITDLGMSHGTIPLQFGVLEKGSENGSTSRVIEKYRMVEVSDLPLENAANPFTDFQVISKEAQMDPKKYLAQFIGEEQAQEFIEKGGLKQAALQKAGVKEAAKSDSPEAPAASQPAASVDVKVDAAELQAVLKAFRDEIDLPGLNEFLTKAKEDMEKVPVLEALVKSLTVDRNKALADAISPPDSSFIWKSRPSQSQGTVLDPNKAEDKILQKSAPTMQTEDNWLSEAVGSTPLDTPVQS